MICPVCLEELDFLKCCSNCRSIFQAVDYDTLVAAADWRLKQRKADVMAASVDLMIYRGALDPRSLVSDSRLSYGNPFSREVAQSFLNSAEKRKVLAARTIKVKLKKSPASGCGESLFFKAEGDIFGHPGLVLSRYVPGDVGDGAEFSVTIELLDRGGRGETITDGD